MLLHKLQARKLLSPAKFYAPVSKTQLFKDGGLFSLEKAQDGGATTLQDITKALDEYARLFKAGISSNAEKLTLARAFPDDSIYVEAASMIPLSETMVIGGPASVELIDREGHMITNDALNNAFKKYMDNFRTRNAMVLHSDVQVGWALPAYITRGGQIYKSGVGTAGLFFICELRSDTKIAEKVAKQIEDGKLRSYSIAGSATKVRNMQKGLMPYMQVDEMELAEVTVCEKGVNQGAGFEILKAEDTPDFPEEGEPVVIIAPEEEEPKEIKQVNISINLLEKDNGDIDFMSSFFNYLSKDKRGSMDESKLSGPMRMGGASLKPTNGHRPKEPVPELMEYMEKGREGGYRRDTQEPHRKRGEAGDRFAYEQRRLAEEENPRPRSSSNFGGATRGQTTNKPEYRWTAEGDLRQKYDLATKHGIGISPPSEAEESSLTPTEIRGISRSTAPPAPSTDIKGRTKDFIYYMENTSTTGEYKPRGVGRSSQRKIHDTDTEKGR